MEGGDSLRNCSVWVRIPPVVPSDSGFESLSRYHASKWNALSNVRLATYCPSFYIFDKMKNFCYNIYTISSLIIV